MKILVFTHRTNFSGGANRSLLSVLIGLRNKNHEIKVVLPRKKGALNDELTKENIPWIYVRYYRMGADARKGVKSLISKSILMGKFVHHYFASLLTVKKIANEKYDIVYMNTILPYVALFTAKHLKIPAVLHDRESLDTTNVWQIPNFEQFLNRYSSKIIVISKDLRNQWSMRNISNNIVLINNGIPFQNCELSNQSQERGLHLILTARISAVKHHDDALKAIIELRKRGYNDIYLHFVGSYGEKSDVTYKEYLDELILNNSLEDVVAFHGEISDVNKIRHMMNIELMCNPNEPFGRVTVEGMRSGLVVVGVNSGGTLDIIEDDVTGVLYKENDIFDFADKIEMLYKDDTYRKKIALAGYDYARNHFTMEENVNNIEIVLKEVCEKNRHKSQNYME